MTDEGDLAINEYLFPGLEIQEKVWGLYFPPPQQCDFYKLYTN